MKQSVYDLLNQMNREDITTRIAFQCAPVIANLKVSNLLTLSSKDDDQVGKILEGTGISFRKLAEDHGRSVFILYRKKALMFWILRRSNQMLLMKAGLGGFSVDRVLDEVCERYRAYVEDGSSYPHEIGVLLGYPPEDVKGFVVNKGRNCLACGYWKVYGDPCKALQCFEAYDRARELILQKISNGIALQTILSNADSGQNSIFAA